MDVNTSGVTKGDVIGRTLKLRLDASSWQWLSAQVEGLAAGPSPGTVARLFTSLPRRLKSSDRLPTISRNVRGEGPGGVALVVQEWTIVRLARVWLLMNIPEVDEAGYVQLIERLFTYGDMEELVALYSALPVYHYPEAWKYQCTEGIRSNIATVRHAVMVNNPYPARFLDEDAWNQLVLKAFFTNEDIPHIVGLKQRNNQRLAQALTDYAYERHAAHREIDPMLWILVGPFMDKRAFDLMARMMKGSNLPIEKQAIAYALTHSNSVHAQQYLKEHDVPDSLSGSSGTPWEMWSNETTDTTNKDY